MRRRGLAIGLLALAVVFGLAIAVSQHAGLSGEPRQKSGQSRLILTPASTVIRHMDPLFVRVTLRNDTQDVVTLVTEFDVRHGGLIIEGRPKGQRDYTKLGYSIHDSGCLWRLEPYRKLIPPSGRCASYEVLFPHHPQHLLAKPGDYELRAAVYVGLSRRLITSQPVTVNVRPISIHDHYLLTSFAEMPMGSTSATNVVKSLFSFGAFSPVDPPWDDCVPAYMQRLSTIAHSLEPSIAKQSLHWKLALAAIRSAKTPVDRERKLEELEWSSSHLDCVTREVIRICLAKQYVEMKEWRNADEVLSRFEEDSVVLEYLRREVKSAIAWEDGVHALFPVDQRLEAKISYELKDSTFRDVLELLTNRTKVPLDASPEFKDFKITGRMIPPTDLRSELFGWSQHFEATWHRRGDGYYLSRDVSPQKPVQ